MARPVGHSMPAWLLKVATFSVTAMVLIASTGYVSAHPQNPLAPLRPPVTQAMQPSDALEELLEVPIIPPPPTPSSSPKFVATPRPITTPQSTRGVSAGVSATRAPVAVVPTPLPTFAPTPAPTRAPLVVIAPSVRATSKPALTAPHSS